MNALPRTNLAVEVSQTERIEGGFGGVMRGRPDVGAMDAAEAHSAGIMTILGGGDGGDGASMGGIAGYPIEGFGLGSFGSVGLIFGGIVVFFLYLGNDKDLEQIAANVLMETIHFVDIGFDGETVGMMEIR
jgi:hypothetical protein